MNARPLAMVAVVSLGVFALCALGVLTYLLADGQSADAVAVVAIPMVIAVLLAGATGLIAASEKERVNDDAPADLVTPVPEPTASMSAQEQDEYDRAWGVGVGL